MGEGRACNLPVPRGFHDDELARLMDDVVLPVAARARPEAVVLTCGGDALAGDPLASMALSNVALWDAIERVVALAPAAVVLGGGGYNPWTLTRYWSGLWARLAGFPIPAALPPGARGVLEALSCDLVDDEDRRPEWTRTVEDARNPGPVRAGGARAVPRRAPRPPRRWHHGAMNTTWLDRLSRVEELEDAELDPALVAEFERARARTLGREIRFSTPTFKSYSSCDMNGCGKNAFPAFSITAGACALNCDHCQAKILEPMIPATDPAMLEAKVRELVRTRGPARLPPLGRVEPAQRDPLRALHAGDRAAEARLPLAQGRHPLGAHSMPAGEVGWKRPAWTRR